MTATYYPTGRQKVVTRLTLVRAGILAVMLAIVGLGAGAARAGVITLSLNAGFSPDGHSDATAGGPVSGIVVIDNTTGAFISANITATGYAPSVGPFIVFDDLRTTGGNGDVPLLTALEIASADGGSFINMLLDTPTPGSLVGYAGGDLQAFAFLTSNVSTQCCARWELDFGSLTQVGATPIPEPSSLLLVVSSLAGAYLLSLLRIGRP
jgi:hypothetical protein